MATRYPRDGHIALLPLVIIAYMKIPALIGLTLNIIGGGLLFVRQAPRRAVMILLLSGLLFGTAFILDGVQASDYRAWRYIGTEKISGHVDHVIRVPCVAFFYDCDPFLLLCKEVLVGGCGPF